MKHVADDSNVSPSSEENALTKGERSIRQLHNLVMAVLVG